jgi:oligosaccharide repeat unit polymerase
MTDLTTTYPRTMPLKPVVLTCLALSVVLVSVIAQLPFVVIAIAILITLVVQVADRSLGTVFLIVASLHATLSYLSIILGGVIGAHADSNVAAFALEAYQVYFFGIAAMIIGYGVSRSRTVSWRPLVLEPGRIDSLTLGLSVAGILLIAYVFNQIGFVQMVLTGTFDRYFGEAQVGPSYTLYQSLLRKALAVLGITIPILLLRWQVSRSKYLLATACVGLIAIVATAHRGYVAVTVLSFVVTNAFYGRNRKAIVIIVLLLAIAFFSAQAVYVNIDTNSDNLLVNTAFVLRSASTEVNDLAWVLAEWNRHWYFGRTWLAGVWPVPATMSKFKDTYVLPSVTKDVAGIPRDAGGGGLRISMFGEAYLNFGYLGVVALGLVFGVVVRKTNSLIAWAKPQGPLVLFPFIFFYMVALCQTYLSGSATLADAILSCLVMSFVYFSSTQRAGAVAAR